MPRSSAAESHRYEDDVPSTSSAKREKLDTSDGQLEDLAKRRTNASEVINKNEAFANIYWATRQDVQKADNVLSKEERKRFEEQLDALRAEKDPEKIRKLQQVIQGTITETRDLTQRYGAELDKNKDLFGKDKARGVDTLQEYKDEFKGKELKAKREWSRKLDDELKSLRDLRANLIKVVGEGKEVKSYMDKFGTMRRHEKRNYVKDLAPVVEGFRKACDTLRKAGVYSEDELENLGTRFREAPLDAQKRMLKDVEQEAKDESAKGLQDVFKKFSPDTQKKWDPELKKARGLKAKKDVIGRMKQGLRDRLIELWQKSKYQSPKEKSFITASIEKEDRPEMLEMFVASFGKVEETIKGFAKKYESMPAEVQAQYDFWNADYSEKESISKQCDRHAEKITKWEAKLEAAVKERLVSKTSAAKYSTGFKKLSLPEKDRILSQSVLDDPRRKAVLMRFTKLCEKNPDLAEKNKHFDDMRLRDRIELVNTLEDGLDKKADCKDKWKKKVEEKVAGRLLAKNSAKAYEDWFNDLEDTDEMEAHLQDSDLDDPRREKVLQTFEELSEKERGPHTNMFYNADLTGRIELLHRILPDNGAALDAALSNMEAAKVGVDALEQQTALTTYHELATTFQKRGNLDGETEIRQKIAKLDPEDEQNAQRLEELKMLKNPNAQYLGQMINNVANIPGMREDLLTHKVMFEIAERARKSEVLRNQQHLDRRALAQGSAELAELSGDLYEYTEGKMMLDERTGMAVDMQVFDAREMLQERKPEALARHRRKFKEEGNIRDHQSQFGRYGLINEKGEEKTGTEADTTVRTEAARITQKILETGTKGQFKGKPSDEAVKIMMDALAKNEGLRLEL